MALSFRAGIRTEAVEDAIGRVARAYRFQDGAWKPRDASIPPRTDEFIEGLPSHLFSASSGGALQSSRPVSVGGNPYARATVNVTRQAQIMKRDPERARQLEAEAIAGRHALRPES